MRDTYASACQNFCQNPARRFGSCG
jgi:hypothetical protein